MLTHEEYIRFSDKVLVDDGCWLWLGAPNTDGYGQLKLRGSRPMAHRVAYEEWVASIPDGLQVLHRCDNPPCVRPDHLFVDTQKANVHDMISKGRRVTLPGESNGQSKLTDQQVDEIRELSRSGLSQRKIASRYGISQMQVSRIVRGVQRRGFSAANRAARLLYEGID